MFFTYLLYIVNIYYNLTFIIWLNHLSLLIYILVVFFYRYMASFDGIEGGSQDPSSQEKKTRGITKMKKVARVRKLGMRLPVRQTNTNICVLFIYFLFIMYNITCLLLCLFRSDGIRSANQLTPTNPHFHILLGLLLGV